MNRQSNTFPWQDKIINPQALGGIETAVLDNGPAAGTRVAWVNTGSGLRYRVAVDRCMDIVEAFHNQYSLAWLSHGGLTAPRPDANHGLEWLTAFAGGLVTTCGLTHIGGPEKDGNGERGLHGRVSSMPATIESIVQPDPFHGKLDMRIVGVMRQSSLFGPNLELRRTLSSTLGKACIRVEDQVTNRGNQSVPHMILYHCNFGWPLVNEGADLVWQGSYTPIGRDMDHEIFNAQHNYRKCLAPLESHRGFGEACAALDVSADSQGMCTVGLHNSSLGLALKMYYAKQQLPCLANWQHWGFGDYVTALEPGTNPPTGQDRARQEGNLIFLEPGQTREYRLDLEILTEAEAIQDFLDQAG